MDFRTVIKDIHDKRIPTDLSNLKLRMWPRFAYHFTDILNAVNILKEEHIYSRNYALQNNLMQNDNASTEVISQTSADVENYVRLYFRPKTPTQFYNEGFQVKSSRHRLHADCPIPVFFVFKLPELLEQSGVQFTSQSLALKGPVPRYSTPEEFSRLPFKDIYQDGPLWNITEQQKKCIIGRKQAEIIVPQKLGLEQLRVILVRSPAEEETLLNLLHDANIYKFDSKIMVQEELYFFMNRNFINEVELTSNSFKILSNTNNAYPEEWKNSSRDNGHSFALNKDAIDNYLNVTIKVLLPDGSYYWWPSKSLRALLTKRIELTLPDALKAYTLIVEIDGHIAYQGNYYRDFANIDMPF